MKKLWLNIVIFFNYFMRGLVKADREAFQGKTVESKEGTGIEQNQERKSVYQDLLKGELTQEVKELRHEMYYAERESKKFVYNGNGTAIRNTNNQYDRLFENSDNDILYIVQDNRETNGSLSDFGVYGYGEDKTVSEEAAGDLRLKTDRKYTIEIKRDFYPRFKIEEFTTKLIVKKRGEKFVLDFYTSAYEQQFNRRQIMFRKGVLQIKDNNVKSDIINFDNVNFIAFNAYGSDDLKYYEFGNLQFLGIIEFDGSLILRFLSDAIVDGDDLITEFFDEIADRKCRNHERREGATIDYAVILAAEARENTDTTEAERLMEELKSESERTN